MIIFNNSNIKNRKSNYQPQATDTNIEADIYLFARLRQLSLSQRLKMFISHERSVKKLCLTGIKIRHRGASVKICQLRLWIELLKNAYYKADNELETFPNIDINIKCGNSLVSRFGVDSEDLKSKLFSIKNNLDIERYKKAVKHYFNAKSKAEKKVANQEIRKIQDIFISGLKEVHPKKIKLQKLDNELFNLENQMLLFEETKIEKKERERKINQLNNEINQLRVDIREIETGRFYKDKKAFEWRFEFPEVLNDRGDFIGFDVIIGNPPYISIQDLSKTEKNSVNYYRNNFESAQHGNFDIYILFIEKINSLTSDCSNSSFILPSKFLTTDYGKNIRHYLLENKLIFEIVDFEHHQVFDTATTYTCIIFANKIEKSSLYFSKIQPSKILEQEYLKNNILYSELFGKTWIFDTDTTNNLLQKIKNKCLKLKDLPCDISRGSSTGNDKIFVLTQENEGFINGYGEYVEIENELLIKPIYATNFNRYVFRDNLETHLIFPYVSNSQNYDLLEEHIIEKKYPKAYRYLFKNKAKLEERKQVKEWYAYSAARSLKNHVTSDILIPLLADKGIFTLTPKDGKYTLMAGGGFSISIKNQSIDKRFLLSLLNSKLLFFVLYRESNKFRGGYITCTKQYFENLPIKLVIPDLQQPFIQLVDQILEAKKSDPNANTTALETEIDRLVYDLYELTEEEIDIIEGNGT